MYSSIHSIHSVEGGGLQIRWLERSSGTSLHAHVLGYIALSGVGAQVEQNSLGTDIVICGSQLLNMDTMHIPQYTRCDRREGSPSTRTCLTLWAGSVGDSLPSTL